MIDNGSPLVRAGCLFFTLEMGEGAWGGGLHRRIPIEGPAPGGGAGLLIWARICVGAGSLCCQKGGGMG